MEKVFVSLFGIYKSLYVCIYVLVYVQLASYIPGTSEWYLSRNILATMTSLSVLIETWMDLCLVIKKYRLVNP